MSDIVLNHPKVVEAKTVFVYQSMPKEVDTASIIARLLVSKRVAVPKIVDRVMYSVEYDSVQVKTRLGYNEPTSFNVLDCEVAIVPALAFDVAKNRLGRGGGYYDRFLVNRHIYKIGICLDDLILDSLITQKHDIIMDEVVTERRIIK